MGSDTMLIDVVVLVRRVAVAVLVALSACAICAQSAPAGPQSRTRPTDGGVLPTQFEFAGSWAPLGTEDVQNDSVPVDYLGLALTDEARTRALSRRSEEHTSELQSLRHLVCRLLLE